MAKDYITSFRTNMSELESMVKQAKKVPMSNLCLVDRDSAIGLIDAVYRDFPKVIAESEGIVQNQTNIMNEARSYADKAMKDARTEAENVTRTARSNAQQQNAQTETQIQERLAQAQQQANALVQDAQERAARILQEAERQARQLISEQEITARANMEAEDLRQNAQEEVNRMYSDFYGHVDQMLLTVDQSLGEQLTEVRMMRQQLNQGV